MANLIDVDKAKEMFPDNGEGSWTYNVTAKAYLDTLPTTTDKEIRAKAIEEFAEKLKSYIEDNMIPRSKGEECYRALSQLSEEYIDEIAEEMKGA